MGRAHRLAGLMTIVYVAYRDAVAYACGCISLSNSGRFASKVDDERTQPGEREDALDALPVRTMTADDEGPAIETVVLAFAADPFTRWGMAASTSVHGRHAEVRPCVRRRRLRAWCGLLHERIHWSGAMVAARSASR